MNLLKRWFGDRRKSDAKPADERRRKTPLARWRETGDRLDRAVDNLEQTISLNMHEFSAMMSREHPANDVQRVVIFSTFADQCEYRLVTPKYQVCKHKEHEGAGTGIAPCAEACCPFCKNRSD